jgi:hypothetical protein
MAFAVKVYALVCLALTLALWLARRRLTEVRTAVLLVVLGLAILSVEEPLLTLWFGLSSPPVERDGIAGLVTGQARAHVIDQSAYALGFFLVLGWIAWTAFRRGEVWALRALAAAWCFTLATEATTAFGFFSRGLPLPGPGGVEGNAGIGWQPLAVALLAWGAGLWIRRAPPRE